MRPRLPQGFTLIELLVAISLMALMAALSWRGLDGMTRAQAQMRQHADDVLALQAGLAQWGSWDAAATRVRFNNGSKLRAWRVTSQGGYDRNAPGKAIKDGIEVVREYTDNNGNVLDKLQVGEEIQVHVKIRATGDQGVGNVAIVDLLPGGFDPVIEPPAPVTDQQAGDDVDEGGDSEVQAAAWRSPIGLSSSTWQPEYADIREDRVVIYGTATPDVREFVYRIKASNAGTFRVPPAYAESMYDRSVQARSPGGGSLVVSKQP